MNAVSKITLLFNLSCIFYDHRTQPDFSNTSSQSTTFLLQIPPSSSFLSIPNLHSLSNNPSFTIYSHTFYFIMKIDVNMFNQQLPNWITYYLCPFTIFLSRNCLLPVRGYLKNLVIVYGSSEYPNLHSLLGSFISPFFQPPNQNSQCCVIRITNCIVHGG